MCLINILQYECGCAAEHQVPCLGVSGDGHCRNGVSKIDIEKKCCCSNECCRWRVEKAMKTLPHGCGLSGVEYQEAGEKHGWLPNSGKCYEEREKSPPPLLDDRTTWYKGTIRVMSESTQGQKKWGYKV